MAVSSSTRICERQRWMRSRSSARYICDMTLAAPIRFLPLYTLLYAGFGVQSPYLPALFDNRGIGPEGIATILAAGTAIRIISGPVAGRVADRLDAPRLV